MSENATMCAGCIFFGLAVGGILLGCSFATVSPTEYGIQYSTFSKKIDEGRIYQEGRYFLGLGQSFLIFPRLVQNIEFSNSESRDEGPITARTSGGNVRIDASLQYTLKPSKLINMYKLYEKNYHPKFVKASMEAIQNSANTISLSRFYNDRDKVQTEMIAAVRTKMTSIGGFVDVEWFQLRKVTLPLSTENTVVKSVIETQKAKTQNYDNQRNVISQQLAVIKGEADAAINTMLSEANAAASIKRQNATSQAVLVQRQAEKESILDLKSNVGLRNDQMMRYLWLKEIREQSNIDLIVGLDGNSNVLIDTK